MGFKILLVWLVATVSAFGDEKQVGPDDWLEGVLVPQYEIRFRVPSNKINLAGVNVSSPTVKITKLVRDGKMVRKGEELASFAFPHDVVYRSVVQQQKLCEAELERERTRAEMHWLELESQMVIAQQEVQKAELEKKKSHVLSSRDSKLIQLAFQMANFEVQVLQERIRLEKDLMQTSEAHLVEKCRQFKKMDRELSELAQHYRILAPEAGRVRLALLEKKRRKARVGDRLPGGMFLLSLLKNDHLHVEYHVLEEWLGKSKEDVVVTVKKWDGDANSYAKVHWVSACPVVKGEKQKEDRIFKVTALLGEKRSGFEIGESVLVKLP